MSVQSVSVMIMSLMRVILNVNDLFVPNNRIMIAIIGVPSEHSCSLYTPFKPSLNVPTSIRCLCFELLSCK